MNYHRFAHKDNFDLRYWFTFLESEREATVTVYTAPPTATPHTAHHSAGAVTPTTGCASHNYLKLYFVHHHISLSHITQVSYHTLTDMTKIRGRGNKPQDCVIKIQRKYTNSAHHFLSKNCEKFMGIK